MIASGSRPTGSLKLWHPSRVLKLYDADRGYRSFGSLNPRLISSTPSAWPDSGGHFQNRMMAVCARPASAYELATRSGMNSMQIGRPSTKPNWPPTRAQPLAIGIYRTSYPINRATDALNRPPEGLN